MKIFPNILFIEAISIFSFVFSKFFGNAEKVFTEIKLNQPLRAIVPKHSTNSYCLNDIDQDDILFEFIKFKEINVYVNTAGKIHHQFDWHAVKGKSTDDFHSNIKYLVFTLFQVEEEEKITDDSKIPNLQSSFLRDILSSCPTPLFSKDLQSCKLSFSTLGVPCVSISSQDMDLPIQIITKKEFDSKYIINLLVGLLFLFIADTLSGSGIFQVTLILIDLHFQFKIN